ncbi:MAG: short-chain fatty acyl-CoA regulator family protein [Salaquimonas sp.]
MADQKIFAGPRIRRIRNTMSLTQTAMAEQLGISPSYLNLIERNQRPLTVQLLLKLASAFDINLEELKGEGSGSQTALKEVFADPLLSDELPGDQELVEIAEAAPNAANGVLKLYRAYRESQERLSDLNSLLAQEGRQTSLVSVKRPVDEVHEKLESKVNYFPLIEEQAAQFSASLGSGAEFLSNLKDWLRKEHNISVRLLPVHAMPLWRRRFDRHSMRLFLSERLSPFDQLREVAMEACLLFMPEAIKGELGKLKLTNDEAIRIARFELARYAAHAVMMPYDAFLDAATRCRYDVDVLRSRFSVSFEQVVNRLTMLQKTGSQGIPFFMLEIDHAGNRFRRAGSQGYPQAQFGGSCPKLPIHAAFSQPGKILVEDVEMPDGEQFMVIARTLEGPQGAFDERVRRTAILLGCSALYINQTVYGDVLRGSAMKPTPIGPICRLCERQGCLSRAEPPITRPAGLDEFVSGLSVFDFR